MPIATKSAIRLAIGNVSNFGDTDIFPFPTENHIFHDKPDDLLSVLEEIDKSFDSSLSSIPVLTSKNLAAVGYSGFRYGTQIDPLWNAYLLALVITIGQDIETRRVKQATVFSYRFSPNTKTKSLFLKEVGWSGFQSLAIENAKTHPFVLRCDISDFYSRIYHHRLENSLRSATSNSEAVRRIMKLLTAISDGPSYGLPVGGPAARLLSELLLNRVDRLLQSNSINYIRFVDDFIVFAATKEAAHSALITISNILLSNEGLSLQKSKTRILSSAEFISTSDFGETNENETPEEERSRTFKRLRVHYDPYSPTADDDYEKLAAELRKFDIVGMLGRELAKSRIDETLARRLISAVKHLPLSTKNDAIRSMLGSIDLLYPIFPSVMLLCAGLLEDLEESVKDSIFRKLRSLIQDNSYITQVPANLSYALRVIVQDPSDETEVLIASTYKNSTSMSIRRDIILMMAHRRAEYWISDKRLTFSTATAWERRALLISSYILGDEGEHWRKSIKNDLNSYEKLVLKWAGDSKQSKGTQWRVPI